MPLGLAAPEILGTSDTALLVVDLQNSNYDKNTGYGRMTIQMGGGDYFFRRMKKVVVPNVKKLLQFFRNEKLKVYYTVIGSETEDYRDLIPRWQRSARYWRQRGISELFPHIGTFEYKNIKEIAPRTGEKTIVKKGGSSFIGTELAQVLKNDGIKNLVVVGQGTAACVECTVRDASDFGFNCLLIEDGCASFSQREHKNAVKEMGGRYANIAKTDNWLKLNLQA